MTLDDLRAALRARLRDRGACAAIAHRVERTPSTVSQIAKGTLTPSAPLHAQLEAALTRPLERRRAGRPLGHSGTVRDRLRMDPSRLSASDWERIRGNLDVQAAEQHPEWALIEARPVSARAVEAAERKVQRLALLPREERTDQTCQASLEAFDDRTDAYQKRRGPSDHTLVRKLIEDAFAGGYRDRGSHAPKVKSDANNLRRWVTARQRAAACAPHVTGPEVLPDWVYDDDEARDDSPRLRDFRAARTRMLAERDILVGPPSPIEIFCVELSRAACWARTVAHHQQDAPAPAERRRRAAASIALDSLCHAISDAGTAATQLARGAHHPTPTGHVESRA